MNSSATLECAEPKTAGSTIRTGNLAVNIDEGLASVDGNAVKLTQREYAILELLSSRKGTIVTREMFLNRLYADRRDPEVPIYRYRLDRTIFRTHTLRDAAAELMRLGVAHTPSPLVELTFRLRKAKTL